MLRARGVRYILAFVLLASSCDSSSSTASDAGAPAEASTPDANDPAPVITPDEWTALQALSPTTLPAPPTDPTNMYADRPEAAHLGQELFYDPGFSGQLLDTDNQGPPQALGYAGPTWGDTGKVSCAGCHVPASGFSDTRSFQLQLSLGAGWGRRRAPSLLDIGQAGADHVGRPQGLAF